MQVSGGNDSTFKGLQIIHSSLVFLNTSSNVMRDSLKRQIMKGLLQHTVKPAAYRASTGLPVGGLTLCDNTKCFNIGF